MDIDLDDIARTLARDFARRAPVTSAPQSEANAISPAVAIARRTHLKRAKQASRDREYANTVHAAGGRYSADARRGFPVPTERSGSTRTQKRNARKRSQKRRGIAELAEIREAGLADEHEGMALRAGTIQRSLGLSAKASLLFGVLSSMVHERQDAFVDSALLGVADLAVASGDAEVPAEFDNSAEWVEDMLRNPRVYLKRPEGAQLPGVPKSGAGLSVLDETGEMIGGSVVVATIRRAIVGKAHFRESLWKTLKHNLGGSLVRVSGSFEPNEKDSSRLFKALYEFFRLQDSIARYSVEGMWVAVRRAAEADRVEGE